MNSLQIEINNKNFQAKFGLKVFRLLGEKWNLPSLNLVLNHFMVLQTDLEDISFDKIDVINDIIFTCINSNPENENLITYDELDELFLTDTKKISETVTQLVQLLSQSLPKNTPEPGKPKVVRKATK